MLAVAAFVVYFSVASEGAWPVGSRSAFAQAGNNTCDAVLYGVSASNASVLYTIDPATGATTPVGPVVANGNPLNDSGGLDFGTAEGETGLYAVGEYIDPNGGGRRVSLLQIDPATGAAWSFGPLANGEFESDGGAVDMTLPAAGAPSSGFYLSKRHIGGPYDELPTLLFGINPPSPSLAPVGFLQNYGDGGLALSPDGSTLYAADLTLRTIDKATGAVLSEVPLSIGDPETTGVFVHGLDFNDATGVLWASVSIETEEESGAYLATIDTATGAVTLIGPTEVDFGDIAWSTPPTTPEIVNVAVSRSVLWPANHKMVDVTVDYEVTNPCGSGECGLSVSSSEPGNGLGDGDTPNDWEVVDAHHVRLRAERSGSGSGRVYTITITCGGATSSVEVVVPHNR